MVRRNNGLDKLVSTFSVLLALSCAVILVAWIIFLVFAQVSVRRLEKHPETKDALGMELVSGWRIFNIAEALVLPMSFFKRIEGGPLFFMYADAKVLRRHSRLIDRILAHLLFWPFVTGSFSAVLLVILDAFQVFD